MQTTLTGGKGLAALAVLALVPILLIAGPDRLCGCSAPPLDPRIIFNNENPVVIDEDTDHTWKVRMQDVSQVGGTIDLFAPPSNLDVHTNRAHKLFMAEFGKNPPGKSPIVGATFNITFVNGDPNGNTPRYQLLQTGTGLGVNAFDRLPGVVPSVYFPSGVPTNKIPEAAKQEIIRNTAGGTIEVWAPGTGFVRDPDSGTTPHWKVVTWSTFWNMDVHNIGYNGAEESVESGLLDYQSYSRGDSPVVVGGSGDMEYTFTYMTPSEPDLYTIEVTAAVDLECFGVYRWYEVKRKKNRRSYDPSGQFIPPTDSNWDYDFATGKITSFGNIDDSVAWIRGPFYAVITGQGSKDPRDTNSVTNVAPDEWFVLVRDRTPPTCVYFAGSEKLYGTTGDLLSEWNDTYGDPKNPEFITVKLIDNNPSLANYGLRRRTASIQGTMPPDEQWRYDENTFKMSFYYVANLYDYQYEEQGEHCGESGYEHGTGCDCAPVYRDKFVWLKVAEADKDTNTDAVNEVDMDAYELKGETYSYLGKKVVPGVEKGKNDAAYSVLTWKIPLTDIKEPLPWHLATTSKEYEDEWEITHAGWGKGKRLKFMAYMNDGSRNENPLKWEQDVYCLEQKEIDILDLKWKRPGNQPLPRDKTAEMDTVQVCDADGKPVENKTSSRNPFPMQPNFFLPLDAGLSQEGDDEDERKQSKQYFGEYGAFHVFDDDRPFLRINLTDSSLRAPVPQTFTFGNIWYGDFKRAAFQLARRDQTTVYTQSNRDILKTGLRPYGAVDKSLAVLDFSKGGDPIKSELPLQGQKMGATPCAYNPWFFRIANPPSELAPYISEYGLPKIDDDRLCGYWVTEDTRLRFDFYNHQPNIHAHDNINTYYAAAAGSGGIGKNPSVEMVVMGKKSGQPYQYPDGGSFIFREFNRGQGIDSAQKKECSLAATVYDQAPKEVGGPFKRTIDIEFFVTPVDMKIFTLQNR